jgi:lantibiotic biosynthesis protein
MTALYQHHGVVLARSTTDPGDLGIPRGLDLADPGAVLGEGQAWLAKTWARDDVREALALASPGLAGRAGQLLATPARPAVVKDLRRAILATASYLLRWQGRVTPFGLFAGILPTATGPAGARTGTSHHAVARADGDWIAVLAKALDQVPGLRARLMVTTSSMAIARDGRLVLSRRPEAGTAAGGPLLEASVRLTRPVQAAIEIASTPVRLANLADELAARFPAAGRGKASALLGSLVDQGFLITSLQPPMTAEDPLDRMITVLEEAGSESLPGMAVRLHALRRTRDQLRAHDACPDPARAAGLRSVIASRMSGLAPGAVPPLAVDLRLDGRASIPVNVLDEAAAAAGVLLRLTTRPYGSPAWTDYHARFLHRYGPGALVPVTDLVADSGLGYPDGYLGSPRQRPAWRALTERDAAFLGLIQQAMLAGASEILLAEADIRALAAGDQATVVPPQRIEIGVALHARSAEAISRGEFELRVVSVPRTPTSMAGRFAHLLTAAERERLADTYDAGSGEDAITAQLSFPPRRPHSENITRVAPLVTCVIPLGEHPAADADIICVDDLAVTADATQMYLIQRSAGRRVIPRIPHALDLTVQAPPLARLIAEVADARTAGIGPLDPGAARALPYVPRIRYRRTILSPARWLLHAGKPSPIPRDPGSWDTWLASWRGRWNVPARVIACTGDLRLPLDLDHPLDRALLRGQAGRTSQLEIREDGPPDGDGWLGRPAELLIPLTLATPVSRPLPVTTVPGKARRPGSSQMLCAQVSGNPARFDDIITGHLPALAERLAGVTERWWLRRHRDMARPEAPQHIAIYLRLADAEDFGQAATELAAMTANLQARGLPGELALASFLEHPGRYGHGDALEAAERVLAADTQAAIEQITMAATAGIPGQAITAASMAQLAGAFGVTSSAGYRALIACLPQGSGPLDRAVREQACRLADPAGGFRALRELPGGDAVAAAWAVRDAELAAYRAVLARQRDPATALRTLLHDHHVRALGVDPEYEQQTGRLPRPPPLQRLALAGQT